MFFLYMKKKSNSVGKLQIRSGSNRRNKGESEKLMREEHPYIHPSFTATAARRAMLRLLLAATCVAREISYQLRNGRSWHCCTFIGYRVSKLYKENKIIWVSSGIGWNLLFSFDSSPLSFFRIFPRFNPSTYSFGCRYPRIRSNIFQGEWIADICWI